MPRSWACRFRDADAEIEAAAGCTVTEIFARYGEAAFRDGERKVLARLLSEPPHVLATGGGAFIDAETRARIKASAISVWLKADVDLLARPRQAQATRGRCSRTATRAQRWNSMLRERDAIYAEADIAVESGAGPHGEVVKRIVAALEAREAKDGPP